MQKLWFDVEFNEHVATLDDGRKFPIIDPISIGVVNERGEGFMRVFNDFNRAAANSNEWLVENVISKLPPEETWKSREEIRQDLLDFIGEEDTQFRYWWAAQDAVVLQSIFSPRFLDQPKNHIRYPYNIAQKFHEIGMPDALIPEKSDAHEVLADAVWTREFDCVMDKFILENNL